MSMTEFKRGAVYIGTQAEFNAMFGTPDGRDIFVERDVIILVLPNNATVEERKDMALAAEKIKAANN